MIEEGNIEEKNVPLPNSEEEILPNINKTFMGQLSPVNQKRNPEGQLKNPIEQYGFVVRKGEETKLVKDNNTDALIEYDAKNGGIEILDQESN